MNFDFGSPPVGSVVSIGRSVSATRVKLSLSPTTSVPCM
jgi:hypothetical protein